MSTHPIRSLTFYTRPGCHLCEDAAELIDQVRQYYDFRLTTIDITSDIEIFERFKYEIPVILVAGGPALNGRIDATALREALERAP